MKHGVLSNFTRSHISSDEMGTRLNTPSPGFALQQRECTTSWREFLWRNAAKILLTGRILPGIPENSFFLGGILASTDFSVGFFPRYAAGIFPGNDPAERTGHLGEILTGSRWAPAILAGSRRDLGSYFSRGVTFMLAGENFSDPPLNDSPGLSGARFSMVIWRLSRGKLLLPPKSNLFNLAVILFKSCFVFKVLN